ncbi:MAG: hypothetical protein ACKVJF_05320 [Flavobacteriales bacterium]
MQSFKQDITSKLPKVGTTIFTTMSHLAAEHNALNLSQGFPNFAPDPLLINLATEAMQADYNQYAPMQGILPLRGLLKRSRVFMVPHIIQKQKLPLRLALHKPSIRPFPPSFAPMTR